ncbi:MAG: response regulator [Rhodocyclaceae bacterium]|nr:response regulator [Rhodocyclaceae bacterium]
MTERTEASGAPPEILIVEDSPVEAELLRRSLDRAGYRVTMAKNGEEGLQAARARPPALVVSDINMPLMGGYELCREIKHDDELWSVPVILLTVLSEPEDILEAIGSGADSYITKPYMEANLLNRVHALLSTPIARRWTEERRTEEAEYNGKRRTIFTSGQQMLNLLLSVYENTLTQNRELTKIQTQLNLLNESLEDQVRSRTVELERVNRALRVISACNVALAHARTEEDLFQSVCRHIVETGSYRLAFVSYPGEGADDPPVPFAYFGDEIAYQCHAELDHDPEHRRHCLVFAALRTGQTQGCNNIRERLECGHLRDAGVEAILALPMRYNHDIHGVLTIFSPVPDAFGAAEIDLMEELAGDLAYGITTLRTRAERNRSAADLRQALEQTITAIALVLEKRDPYTAGHQQRVAGIASAIAVEMGLTPQQIEGLHFGALIHDLGKVYVPSEILNRPGKLTDLEFGIIKAHAQVGYDVLKDITFPWPAAQMAHQHHERMDGSGYPLGLKGDGIILEARILAVADVVEAMSSHRPYRPALGIEAALDEIERGKGSRYDPTVVEACIRAVKNNGMKLPSSADGNAQ